jgi:hypothetical protein
VCERGEGEGIVNSKVKLIPLLQQRVGRSEKKTSMGEEKERRLVSGRDDARKGRNKKIKRAMGVLLLKRGTKHQAALCEVPSNSWMFDWTCLVQKKGNEIFLLGDLCDLCEIDYF